MILNIGCGHLNRDEGEIGMDIDPGCNPDVVGNVENIPFPDEHFDRIKAVHILEHLPDLVKVMDECWRVCKKGGRFHIRVPLFPTIGSIADPTHCRYFIPETFDYFVRDGALPALKNRWESSEIRVTEGEIYAVLRKA